MKICFIANIDSVHVQRWVKYFTGLGHEVHIISDSSIEKNNIGKAKIHRIKKVYLSRNIVTFYINLLINVIYVNRLIKIINPDILHAHYVLYYGFYGIFSSFHPFIISAWGSDVLKAPNESRISEQLVAYTLKKADKITTTAKFMVSFLVDRFQLIREKVIRIPWGIDMNIFYQKFTDKEEKLIEKLKIRSANTLVLSNRSMAPQYNIEKIIESIPFVLESNPKTIFLFIKGYGTTDFEKKMKEKANKLGVSNNTRFISEKISEEEMATYLNITDMFISITKTDQFASSIMEGMACGAIPIVSNIKPYHQYLSDNLNSLFVDPENPVDLAKKIIYCIEHPEVKENFNKINKEIILKHEDWDKNALKMLNLYEELLKGESK